MGPNRVPPPFFHPSQQYPPGPFPPGPFPPIIPPPIYYGPPSPAIVKPRMDTPPSLIHPDMVLSATPISVRNSAARKFAGVPTSLKVRRNTTPSLPQSVWKKSSMGLNDLPAVPSIPVQDDEDFEKYMEEMKALGAC